jgi:hypothetical protein
MKGMCCYIECELIEQLKSSLGFAMPDESNDVAGLSLFLTFIRHTPAHNKNQVEEEMLMCKPTKGEDIFNLTDLCMAQKNLTWKQCVGICIDGTRPMVRKMGGFTAQIKTMVLARFRRL